MNPPGLGMEGQWTSSHCPGRYYFLYQYRLGSKLGGSEYFDGRIFGCKLIETDSGVYGSDV